MPYGCWLAAITTIKIRLFLNQTIGIVLFYQAFSLLSDCRSVWYSHIVYR